MTSVRFTSDSLTSGTLPTQTAAYVIGGWAQIRSGGYSPAGDSAIIAFGTTGGASQGFQLSVGAGLTTLVAFIFANGGASFDPHTILTGSDTAWIAWVLEYPGTGTAYTLLWRKEGALTWTSVTLDCAVALTGGGSMFIGCDQFTGPSEFIIDGNVKGFWCQASFFTIAGAFIASQSVSRGVAPVGTNLHWLILNSSVNVNVNGGTAGNWTTAGTPATDASEPVEADTHLRTVGGYGGTSDVSANNTDHTISFTITIGATNNRKVVLPIAYFGVTTGVTAITFNGSATGVHLSAQQQSSLASLAGCDIYEILDANLPGAGTYTVSVTVDGATGVACGTPVYVEGVAQSYATNTGLATGTGTSITATLGSSASAGSILVGELLDVSFGDAPVSGANQLPIVSQATSSVIRQNADAKYVPAAGANSMSWSSLTNVTGKIAVVIEAKIASAAQPADSMFFGSGSTG